MARDTLDDTPIEDRAQLAAYIAGGEKPREDGEPGPRLYEKWPHRPANELYVVLCRARELRPMDFSALSGLGGGSEGQGGSGGGNRANRRLSVFRAVAHHHWHR